MLGLRKVIEADADEINGNIVELVFMVGENVVYFGICLTRVPISFITISMSCT